MIYVQIRNCKNEVLAKPKTVAEAVKLAERLRDERKETINIYSTKPEKVSANYYRYGYHLEMSLEYEKKFLFCVNGGEWERVAVNTEEQFNSIISAIKKANPNIKLKTKIE